MKGKIKNIVVIWSDQQRWDTILGQWSKNLKTPCIDDFAKEAAVFTRGYCSSPVCTPSRATVITGLYPHTHTLQSNGKPLPEDKTTMAEMLKPLGYKTGYIGKWHIGHEPIAQRGFDVWKNTEGYYKNEQDNPELLKMPISYDLFLKDLGYEGDVDTGYIKAFSRNTTSAMPEEACKANYCYQEAKKFIEENKDEPFFLHVNYLQPHAPYYSCWDDKYDPEKDVELPNAYGVELDDKKPLKYKIIAENANMIGRNGALHKDEKLWRAQIAKYWGMVSLVDKYTGKILDVIKENGLWENTAIVYTSDHGDMMGDFYMLAKGAMHDSASRIPYIIRIPGLTDKGIKIDAPVDNSCLVPTLLDAVGAPIPAEVQGKSLIAAMEGKDELNQGAFVEYKTAMYAKGKPYLAVSDSVDDGEGKRPAGKFADNPKYKEWQVKIPEIYGKETQERCYISKDLWKLVITEAREHQLYDLTGDPYELHNLYGVAEYADKQNEMIADFKAWQKKTNDPISFDFNAIW